MSKTLILLIFTVCLISCEKETSTNNFRVPIATNGITYYDDLIWVADLFGQSITAVNPETGYIEKQYDFSPLNIGPDDLIFLDDGTIIWTSPTANKVGKISTDGVISILSETNGSANPITQNKETGEVFIGYTSENGVVSRVDPVNGTVTEVVTGLPSINAFSFAENGLLYAPLFSVEGLLTGEGGVIKINLDSGAFEEWEVSFPNESNKQIFKNTTAVKIDNNNDVFVSIPTISADNIALDDNGNLYVTTFIQNIIFVFDQDGNRRKITIQK
jgi:sugar lactone lactonase YvrE